MVRVNNLNKIVLVVGLRHSSSQKKDLGAVGIAVRHHIHYARIRVRYPSYRLRCIQYLRTILVDAHGEIAELENVVLQNAELEWDQALRLRRTFAARDKFEAWSIARTASVVNKEIQHSRRADMVSGKVHARIQ